MPGKKTITTAQRRRQDYLRQKTLRVASVYETRLAKDRRAELRRVLRMAKDYSDPIALVPLLQGQLDESGYLGKWWTGLVTDAGMPIAKATARDLRAMKAAGEEDIWLASLRRYATTRAGQEISVVSGTWKNTLVGLVRGILAEDAGQGIEKVTQELYERYLATIEKWQCRRIAQTEAMIGMAQAASDAADTLGIPFTKQWCISGLGNTRGSHELMDGVIVDQDEPFSLPGGMMMFPHDTSMGAAAGEIINCACCCIRSPKNPLADVPDDGEPQSIGAEDLSGLTPEEQELLRETRVFEMVQEMADQPLDYETKRAIALNNLELEEALGIRKGAPMSVEDADKQKANPNYYVDDSYQENCATTTPAFVLRERGFNVIANGLEPDTVTERASLGKGPFKMWKNIDGSDATPSLLDDWMKAKGYQRMNEPRYLEYFNEECRDRGTYVFSNRWKGDDDGHVMIIKRMPNGKLTYIETQHYKKILGVYRDVEEIAEDSSFKPTKADGILRVDNKLFDVAWVKLFSHK